MSVTDATESLRMILDGWLRRESAAATNNSSPLDDDTLVAAVESSKAGFLAAVAIGEDVQLVVAVDGDTSTNLESQIAACRLASGDAVELNPPKLVEAEVQIRDWARTESASAMAGISNSKALRRRRLANRIDKTIESAPPHLRASRLVIAARARNVVASQQSAAIEAELASLANSDLADDEWLQAIAQTGPTDCANSPRAPCRDFKIRALLLLQAFD